MIKRKIFLFTVVSLLIFCGWTATQSDSLSKAQWLIGTWENKTARGSIYETWVKKSDDEFLGKSYMKKENDTLVLEHIRLVKEANQLFYIPAVKNQNEGLPIRFGLKISSDTQLVFENPEHDFPQIISYTRINRDSLIAEISGTKNGQPRKQTFPMKKLR
ncbi:DUF6265 family protein [Pedobacter sp. Du54]|uniref:DUF6265 family protein n=1 Tax=Pedobacter anseongensis TaxID=3133439 RepID=UPI00309853C0